MELMHYLLLGFPVLRRTRGSDSCIYEEFYIVGYNAVHSVWNNRSFDWLASGFISVSCLAYTSNQKKVAKCSSKRWLASNGLHFIMLQRIEIFLHPASSDSNVRIRVPSSSIILHDFTCYVCMPPNSDNATWCSLCGSMQSAPHSFFILLHALLDRNN
jgi:hypothetical protein